MQKFLVGIDFTDADQCVLDVIKPIAKHMQATVTLFHCVPPMSQWVGCYLAYVPQDLANRKEIEKVLNARLGEVAKGLEADGITTDFKVIAAHPGPGIVEFAEDNGFDQIVIGTHSKNRIERALLGSAVGHVLRKSSVPVLVVPSMA